MPIAKGTRRKVKRSRSPASLRRRSAAANPAPTRRPLATSNKQCDKDDIWSKLVGIFNDSQYVNKLDDCISRMTDLYASSDFNVFEKLFIKVLRRLLQSDHTNYLKQACQFICKLLKQLCSQHDERLVRAGMEVANHFMQLTHEDCRLNAVFLVSKFMSQIDAVDEEVYDVLKPTLAKRIRDKKASIRSHAVLAAVKFQEDKDIQQAFEFHFNCDPELSVRKALILIMDTKVFGCDFLIKATQDVHESIRSSAYTRLAKIPPSELKLEQLHQVLHNGLFERDRTVSYAFKANMMAFWVTKLYDGTDLVKLLRSLDVINYTDDISKLLEQLHTHNLNQVITSEDEDESTRLHQVVLAFQEKWLDEKRLPDVKSLDERMIVVWLSLISFCKSNQVIIKATKDPASQQSNNDADPNESIESIIDSQENPDDKAPLYELLMPDLINLVTFMKRYVRHVHSQMNGSTLDPKWEFMYQLLMKFLSTYEIGDDSELRVVQDVLSRILKENLLTSSFNNYIPPIVKCLKIWVFPMNKDSHLLVSYIAELINNIRSHLEDEQVQGQNREEDEDDMAAFRDHMSELLECLQMYYACLENVKLTEVPVIMKNQLTHLTYEALEAFRESVRVRVWIAACTGITAFMDKSFAEIPSTMTLLMTSCTDKSSIEIQTIAYKALVDIMIQHDELEVNYGRLNHFLTQYLREYGKYDDSSNISSEEMDFVMNLIRGTAKLYYFRKLSSPEILAHIVLWWYHPKTHGKIRQYIGVFLPLLVKHASRQQQAPIATEEEEADESWLAELLSGLVVTSISYLHSYILGPGQRVMDEGDMNSLINFLCNLVPAKFHQRTIEALEERLDNDLANRDGGADLAKYLKRAKKSLVDLRSQPQQLSEQLADGQVGTESKLESTCIIDSQTLCCD